jgi:uncharacterized membrane protein YqjE
MGQYAGMTPDTVDLREPARPDASLAELISRVSDDAKKLVRAEVALAKAELSGKAKAAGIGAGMFGAAGVIVWFAVAVLIAAAVLGLAVVWPYWLAALVVGVALFLFAGLLVLVGRGALRRAQPLAPTQAIESVKADIAAISARLHR